MEAEVMMAHLVGWGPAGQQSDESWFRCFPHGRRHIFRLANRGIFSGAVQRAASRKTTFAALAAPLEVKL